MKILITGGCGFVGSNIAIFLKKRIKNLKISSLDNLNRNGSKVNLSRLKKNGINNFKVNIEDYKKLNLLPKYDLVIDCCAEPAIEASLKDIDRVFNSNLVGTFNILKKCLKDKSNLIFLSSSRVYSINALRKIINKKKLKSVLNINKTINEDFETADPSSLYGFTKISSEKLIKEMFFNTNLKYIINRFGVIAGPWQFGKQDQGFVSLWIARHILKKNLKYIGFGGTGHQIRDVLHINDVCDLILLQIRRLKIIYNDTFNVGGGLKNKISLKDLTLKCQFLIKRKIKIKKISRTSIFDIPYYVTDNRKIKKVYNWEPKLNINIVLSDIYKWLKSNNKLLNYFK